MKYLGIDYGAKRVGIAVSDADASVAFPKVVLENTEHLISDVQKLALEYGVQAIVIGESKDFKGNDNTINPAIITFKRELGNAIKLPMFLEPEFMTSAQVENTFGKTDMLDASAAAIILQTYMSKEKARVEKKKQETEEAARGEKIDYDTFKKVELKVGKILSAERVEHSDKLLKLSVDFAENAPRQIVSGIGQYLVPEHIIGKHVAFVTNLAPRTLVGLVSDGMILAAKSGETLALVEFPDTIAIGTILG